MHLKNQLLVFALLILLALSITPTHKNEQPNKAPTSTVHTRPAVQSKVNATKDGKVTEVAKTASTSAKN